MESEKTNPEIEISDEERLKLQQLLTRRALIDVNGRKSTRSEDKDSPGDSEVLDESDSWQLIPADTRLHDWQDKCLKKWLTNGRGTVKVATGGGKTLFALAAAQQLQNSKVSDLRLAIVVPTIHLMYQWLDELGGSNLHPSQIGLLGDGNTMDETEDIRVIIAVINTAKDKLPDIIKRMKWRKKLLLVVDECHRANATKARKIFDTKPAYTLGLSATPEVNTIEEPEQYADSTGNAGGQQKLQDDAQYANSAVGKALGKIIFDFSIKDCLKAGLLTKFDVYHIGLELNKSENAKHTKMSREISDLRKTLLMQYEKGYSRMNFISWCQFHAKQGEHTDAVRFIGLANERKRLLYSAESRKAFTLLALRAANAEAVLKNNDSKAIVFHESIPNINAIYCAAEKENLPVVLEHSNLPANIRTENIELFRKGVSRIIISAKSLVEGFNVPSADVGIIAASSSSVRQRIQSLGRMLRIGNSTGNAIIFVLYIKNTADEAIYDKIDWESVLGFERNRYFIWSNSNPAGIAPESMEELVSMLEEEKR